MTFDASALASGSHLPHSFPSGIRLLSVVFLSALVTGSGVSPRPDRTVALLAQKEDKRNQNYNPNAQPYLEEPMKKLVKRIPELKGLRPEADQQALPMVLEKSAERVDEFFANIVDLLAHEEITQERLNGIGVIGAFEQVRDSYLILRRGRESGATIGEYRMDKNGNRMEEVGLDKGFFVTSGFALICNYFSTAFQPESTFRYLGDERIGPRDTYVVAFAQKPGQATLFVTMAERGGTRVHMLTQGIVWVDKSNFQIIRMRTDLLAPNPEIGLEQQTTVVTFSKVQLLDVATPLWLPMEVKVYLKFKALDPDHRQFYEVTYRNEHHYADYQRYRVSVKMKTPQ
jgi:hypothetical protein